jgi:glycerol-3-phosphate cytidylyltransferase
MTVITFGTFDVLHVGHVRILRRARELGSRLVVGVSTDELNFRKKGRLPIYPEKDRMEIIKSIRWVDEVFFEESLEAKRDYIVRAGAKVLVMGDDWVGKFDSLSDICEVVCLDRTPSVSTTSIIEVVQQGGRMNR